MTEERTCEKAGCLERASHEVTLDAADGSMTWWACRPHALEFREWVINETNRQGEHWASVLVEHIKSEREQLEIEWLPGSL